MLSTEPTCELIARYEQIRTVRCPETIALCSLLEHRLRAHGHHIAHGGFVYSVSSAGELVRRSLDRRTVKKSRVTDFIPLRIHSDPRRIITAIGAD